MSRNAVAKQAFPEEWSRWPKDAGVSQARDAPLLFVIPGWANGSGRSK
ncbi:hypothetical protein V1283_003731 [Bradyrhizobium sp. AZCC 2262]